MACLRITHIWYWRNQHLINTWGYAHPSRTLFTDKPTENLPLTIPNWSFYYIFFFWSANWSYVPTSEPLNKDCVYEFPKVHLIVIPSSSIKASWECWYSKGQNPICCAFTVSSWYACGTYSTWIVEHQSVWEQEQSFSLSCDQKSGSFELYSSRWHVLFFASFFQCFVKLNGHQHGPPHHLHPSRIIKYEYPVFRPFDPSMNLFWCFITDCSLF